MSNIDIDFDLVKNKVVTVIQSTIYVILFITLTSFDRT